MPADRSAARRAAVVCVLLIAIPAAALLAAPAAGTVSVVAAEDFYGDVARQIGGDRVTVTSIMSDPRIDPHRYVSSAQDAAAVANADIVIENGGGYDAWMDKLLSASPAHPRIVLKGLDIAVNTEPGNDHVWYNVENIQAVALDISRRLERMLPEYRAEFVRHDRAFQQSLETVLLKMARFSARWAGTPVGLAEPAFLYELEALGLRVLTPIEVQKAIADGSDPPPGAAAEAQSQIAERKIRLLIYNTLAVSPIAAQEVADAQRAGIPAVGMTEIMPPGDTYQSWMLHQLSEISAALEEAGS